MNKAIKIISYISIVAAIISMIVLFVCAANADSIVDYAYRHGDLEYQGRPATPEDLPTIKKVFKAMFIVCGIVELFGMIIPVLAIKSTTKSNTFQLVLGIIALFVGHTILGILLIVSFAIRNGENKNESA